MRKDLLNLCLICVRVCLIILGLEINMKKIMLSTIILLSSSFPGHVYEMGQQPIPRPQIINEVGNMKIKIPLKRPNFSNIIDITVDDCLIASFCLV